MYTYVYIFILCICIMTQYSNCREDSKTESPKIGETSLASGDAFLLKKDDRTTKSGKPTSEEKRTGQKSIETIATKKPLDSIKRVKRDKRDGSTDSDDSDTEGKNKSNIILQENIVILLLII